MQCRPELTDDKFWVRTKPADGGCMVWTAGFDRDGYGRFYAANLFKSVSAHKYAFLKFHGEPADGLVIDHICKNRACVNPVHLRAVTPKFNVYYSEGIALKNKLKTHCHKGHEFTPENTYRRKDGKISRDCIECRRESSVRCAERKRAGGSN